MSIVLPELKKDKNGLSYLEFDTVKGQKISIDKRGNLDVHLYSDFYEIPGTKDYIIKHNLAPFNSVQRKKVKELISFLISKQNLIKDIDFPIGYCMDSDDKLCGQIIRYYPDGLSLKDVTIYNDLWGLMNYYKHDDDTIHNLFLLFNDIINLLEEMVNNQIYYSDINMENIILTNNSPKIIDFDYRYTTYGKERDDVVDGIIFNYLTTLNEILRGFYVYYKANFSEANNFKEARQYVKRMENKVRRD